MEILMADKIEDIIRVLNFKDTEAEKIEDKLLSKFLKYVHGRELPILIVGWILIHRLI